MGSAFGGRQAPSPQLARTSSVCEPRRLKLLEEENRKLKQLVADLETLIVDPA